MGKTGAMDVVELNRRRAEIKAQQIRGYEDFKVYDIINLNDGTALFYEKSNLLGMARVTRMGIDNGLEYSGVEVETIYGQNNKAISDVLNTTLMIR